MTATKKKHPNDCPTTTHCTVFKKALNKRFFHYSFYVHSRKILHAIYYLRTGLYIPCACVKSTLCLRQKSICLYVSRVM